MPGSAHILMMLQIACTSEVVRQVRQAAAITAKNVIGKMWEKEGHYSDADKDALRNAAFEVSPSLHPLTLKLLN